MEFLRRALDYALVGSFKRKAAFVAGASFVVGFSMETFMVHTGFYKIVTQKEADRRQEAIAQEELVRARLRRWDHNIANHKALNDETEGSGRGVEAKPRDKH